MNAPQKRAVSDLARRQLRPRLTDYVTEGARRHPERMALSEAEVDYLAHTCSSKVGSRDGPRGSWWG